MVMAMHVPVGVQYGVGVVFMVMAMHVPLQVLYRVGAVFMVMAMCFSSGAVGGGGSGHHCGSA